MLMLDRDGVSPLRSSSIALNGAGLSASNEETLARSQNWQASTSLRSPQYQIPDVPQN